MLYLCSMYDMYLLIIVQEWAVFIGLHPLSLTLSLSPLQYTRNSRDCSVTQMPGGQGSWSRNSRALARVGPVKSSDVRGTCYNAELSSNGILLGNWWCPGLVCALHVRGCALHVPWNGWESVEGRWLTKQCTLARAVVKFIMFSA